MLSSTKTNEPNVRSGAGGKCQPQVVFCVCSDASTVQLAAATTAAVPGFAFAGAFADYITAENVHSFRRP